MKIITQRLQPKLWIRSGVLLILLASLLPIVLVGPAFPLRGRVAANRTKPAAPSVTLRGEEAIAELKQQGSYDLLAAALAATRYQLRWVEQPTLAGVGSAWQAANPAQGLQAHFTPGAVRIAKLDTSPDTAATANSAQHAGRQPDWQFGIKLTEYGYGGRLSALSDGTVTTNGARVELARAALNSGATITEWYVNEAAGLEQGFTLATPPESLASKGEGEKLRLRLALTGDLWARASSDGQSVALLNRSGAQVLTYGGLVVRDARERKLEARMTVADGDVVIEADDAGAVYPVVIDPTFTQFVKLTASDGAANDRFGNSVSLSGDTVLVGACIDQIGGNAAQGSAYVFVRSGTIWTQQQKLTANDGAAGDQFGRSVALSGDTALVGAYSDDIGGNADQGSVYVFVRSGTTWTQQQKLIASDGAADDQFGYSVALSGDTALVGASLGDNSITINQGTAYVFVRNGAIWTQQQKLIASDGAANDQFGVSVALSGDTALIGAYFDNIGGIATQGSAYVFVRTGTTWTQQQKLFASDGALSDQFGISVALSSDTALVGAAYDDIGGSQNQGSVYVFVRSGTAWTQQQKLTASDGAADDSFGYSVALSGDTVMVGASFDSIGGIANQGSAYLFSGSSTLPQQARLIASDGAASDNVGYSVALSGDTALVGAYHDDFGGNSNQGSAYVFVRSGSVWTQQQQLTANDGAAGDQFGYSVALSGDTALVGAFLDDNSFNFDQGSAYVFVRSGAIWTQQQKLTANDGTTEDYFGYSVALGGDMALVGAAGDDIAPDQGSAYVFVRSGTTWTQQQKLVAGDGAGNDQFGRSVALSGDTALVGSPFDDIVGNGDQGSAYIFVRSGTTWTQQQKLTASDGTATDDFGISVALGGNTALVGATGSDIGGSANQGAAYVFARTGTNWTQQQKLTASDGVAGDSFGGSVALDGDTALLGAETDDINGGVDQGSAYVFMRSGTTWIQQQKLLASDGEANDRFGHSVALSGGKALVGAFLDDVNGITDQGSAYVFGTNCPVITLSPATLPAGTAGNPYSQTLTSSGGAVPYSFTVSLGTLPNGVTLTGGGLLSGTPTTFGSFNFTVQATDSGGCTGTRVYTLTISAPCPGITVNPATLPNGTVGTAYNQTVTATGGTPAYAFSISAGALPGGLNLASDGALAGTPNSGGTFNFTIKATDAGGCFGTRAYTVTINGGGANNGLQFYPLAHPVRLLDTRPGQTGCDAPGAQITGNTSRTQTAAGRTCDGLLIPASARALTGNITTVQSGGGYLTLYPSDAQQPLVANSNYNPNEILNNVFTVGLGAGDGAFKIFVTSNTHLVVDVTGYYAPPGPSGLYFHPLPKPIRLLETRAGQTGCTTPSLPLPGGVDTIQQARLTCDGVTIPATALAIVGNATTVNPQGPGFPYLTLFPADAAKPLVASSNYLPGQVMNAPFTVGLSAAGEFNISPTTQTDLVIDVLGYYSPEAADANGAGLLFNPLAKPVRLLETRAGLTGCYTPNAPLFGGSTRTQVARGVCDGVTIANNARAVVGNATVVNSNGGYLTFWPSNAVQPLVATSNFSVGQVFNRHFTVGLGSDGAFKAYTQFTTDLIVDVSGFFAP